MRVRYDPIATAVGISAGTGTGTGTGNGGNISSGNVNANRISEVGSTSNPSQKQPKLRSSVSLQAQAPQQCHIRSSFTQNASRSARLNALLSAPSASSSSPSAPASASASSVPYSPTAATLSRYTTQQPQQQQLYQQLSPIATTGIGTGDVASLGSGGSISGRVGFDGDFTDSVGTSSESVVTNSARSLTGDVDATEFLSNTGKKENKKANRLSAA